MRQVLLAAVLVATVAACTSRETAVQAIAEAEDAITDVHAYALRNAPDEFKAVVDEYKAAREHLAAEEYRAAARSARKAADLARNAARAATANRKELEAEWATLRDSLAVLLSAIDERVAELSRAPAPPRGVTGEQLAAAKAASDEMAQGLLQATRAAERREFGDAVHAATLLKTRADEVMVSLGTNQKTE